MTTSTIRNYLVIMLFAIALMGVLQSSAFGFPMTIDAIDDAGQWPEQPAYLKLVYPSGPHVVTTQEVLNQWASSSQASSYASSIVPQNPPEKWHFESAGNIWSSSDLIVGEALTGLSEGIYRISVVGGAFMYDSFSTDSLKWSDYKNQWRWQLHIQALQAIKDGQIVDYLDYMLGSFDPYSSAGEALQASLGMHIDIPLAEDGSLIFWIWDNPNTIDNLGSLTFDVAMAPIPEPSTLILVGTGLFFLVRRLRGSLILLN